MEEEGIFLKLFYEISVTLIPKSDRALQRNITVGHYLS